MRLEIDNGTSSFANATAIRSSCSGCRKENNNEIAIASTFDCFNFLTSLARSRSSSGSITSPEATTRSYTQAQFVSNERRRLDGIQVVELGSRLTTDHEHVLKTTRRDQCSACATALQEGISSNSRPVHDFDLIESRTGFSTNTRESLLDCE